LHSRPDVVLDCRSVRREFDELLQFQQQRQQQQQQRVQRRRRRPDIVSMAGKIKKIRLTQNDRNA